MKTLEDGQKLAESMVRIGKACGRNVVAVMSNMDIPLGFYIGNALEVREAVEVLRGHGCPDLTGVCITLAANMLHLCNGWPIEEATKQAEEAINSGKAFEQMKRWIAAQGGDGAFADLLRVHMVDIARLRRFQLILHRCLRQQTHIVQHACVAALRGDPALHLLKGLAGVNGFLALS